MQRMLINPIENQEEAIRLLLLANAQNEDTEVADIKKVSRPKYEKKLLICPYEGCLKEF